jgi:hypothetical protein
MKRRSAAAATSVASEAPFHASPYQSHKQERGRAQPGFSGSGLLDMDKDRRVQYRRALVQEMTTTNQRLYEEDVLRVSSIYFLPMHLIRAALKNATSVRSDDRGCVNLDVFMRRLCGEIEMEEEVVEEERRSSHLFRTRWNQPTQQSTRVFSNKISPKSSPLSPKLSGRMPWSSRTTRTFQLHQSDRRYMYMYAQEGEEEEDYSHSKNSGTQTGIYGDYGTSLSEMESIVEKHELKSKVQSRIRTLLQKQKKTVSKAKDSRHELMRMTTKTRRSNANGHSNGGVGQSSGGGQSSSMRGIFDYSSTSGSDAEAVTSFSSHYGDDDDKFTSVLDRDEELLTNALSESMREVKKCRNALNVANFVVTELRTKNERLVQQSFRKKMGRSLLSSSDAEVERGGGGRGGVIVERDDDNPGMDVPLEKNDFFEVREEVGKEESPAVQ